MSQHHAQPPTQQAPTQQAGYPAYAPQKAPASGLGITAGILSIVSSLWVLVLATGMIALVVQGFGGATFSAVAFSILSLAAFVLGIIQIVRNRKREAKLPLALVGVAGLVIVVNIVAAAQGNTGGAFWLISTLPLVPVIVLSLLAYLSARKASRPEPAPHA